MLNQVATKETLSFPRRTRASTSALVTMIVGSSAILAGGLAIERLSALGVITWSGSSRTGSTVGEAGA